MQTTNLCYRTGEDLEAALARADVPADAQLLIQIFAGAPRREFTNDLQRNGPSREKWNETDRLDMVSKLTLWGAAHTVRAGERGGASDHRWFWDWVAGRCVSAKKGADHG